MSETLVEILTRQNKQLRERVAELEETVIQLREQIAGGVPAELPDWLPHLTKTEERHLIALRDCRHDYASKDYLMQKVYEESGYGKEPPDTKIVDVYICKLRTKLADLIQIETCWGRGYRIDDVGKDLLARVSAPLTQGAAQ